MRLVREVLEDRTFPEFQIVLLRIGSGLSSALLGVE
jgi:hypothetical protein